MAILIPFLILLTCFTISNLLTEAPLKLALGVGIVQTLLAIVSIYILCSLGITKP